MPRFKVGWKFVNTSLVQNGRSGEKVVPANSEIIAIHLTKEAASKKLFGTTLMYRYVNITSIRKISE